MQIPLILGLINVIYNPLQHLLHVSPDVISLLADKTMELTGVADLGTVGSHHNGNRAETPGGVLALPGVNEIVEQIKQADLMFSVSTCQRFLMGERNRTGSAAFRRQR